MNLFTDRLTLREFQADDWPAVLAYQSDPRYLRYYPWTERTPADAQAFVRMFLAQQQQHPRTKFQLAIVHNESQQLIGNCGIRLAAHGARTADIGYEIAPDFWGHGYATEAARAIVHFGFSRFQLHRVWAECVAENVGSIRVLEKLGMRREGRLRETQHFKDRWWDTLLYAVLEDEWQ